MVITSVSPSFVQQASLKLDPFLQRLDSSEAPSDSLIQARRHLLDCQANVRAYEELLQMARNAEELASQLVQEHEMSEVGSRYRVLSLA